MGPGYCFSVSRHMKFQHTCTCIYLYVNHSRVFVYGLNAFNVLVGEAFNICTRGNNLCVAHYAKYQLHMLLQNCDTNNTHR